MLILSEFTQKQDMYTLFHLMSRHREEKSEIDSRIILKLQLRLKGLFVTVVKNEMLLPIRRSQRAEENQSGD